MESISDIDVILKYIYIYISIRSTFDSAILSRTLQMSGK